LIATSTAQAGSLNTPFPSTVISDAFEAVTNGMNNTEALEDLEAKAEQTGSAEWVYLIQAIQAFYSQDFNKMDSLLMLIPEISDAANLKNVLYHMSGLPKETAKLTYHEEKLSKRITENSRFLRSAVEQLKESIEYGEDLFVETASLLIKEVRSKTPEASERLALWSFSTCIENEFDDEALADNILMLFGQAEGLRIIALSLIETEPESALICFTRSLIKRLVDRTTDREETAGYLTIIDALLSACPVDEPSIIDITELLSMLESELCIFFGLETTAINSKPAQKIAEIKRKLSGESVKTAATLKPLSQVKAATQLELF
jgi:hypothetical protein